MHFVFFSFLFTLKNRHASSQEHTHIKTKHYQSRLFMHLHTPSLHFPPIYVCVCVWGGLPRGVQYHADSLLQHHIDTHTQTAPHSPFIHSSYLKGKGRLSHVKGRSSTFHQQGIQKFGHPAQAFRKTIVVMVRNHNLQM